MKKERFKKIRKKLNLTQGELAEVLSLSGKMAVGNIELGFRNPSKLAGVVMSILNSLSDAEATEFMDQLRSHSISLYGKRTRKK